MKQKDLVIKAAIAAAFGSMAVPSFAVVDLVAGTNTAKFASEIPSTTTVLPNAGNRLDMTVAMPSGIKPSNAKPVYVKVNLTNGAKFNSTPTISCTLSGAAAGGAGTGGGTTAGANTGAGVNVGGAGFSNVTFVISGYHTAADGTREETGAFTGGNCTISASAYTISGLNAVAASATVEYTNGLSTATTGNAANLITFGTGVSATFLASDTTPKSDATSGSDNYVTGSNLTQHTAQLGYIQWSSIGSAVATGGSTAYDVSFGITTASVTVSGPALAAALALGNSGAYLSDATACANTTIQSVFQSSGTNSVTFTATPTQISAGVYVCARASGTTVVTTGQITAALASTTAVSNVTFASPSGNLSTVGANGTTKNAYFVNASTSSNKTSVVRIINTGGISGQVWGTAYDESGTAVGTANSTLGTVAANQMLTLTSADLESAIGYTPSAGTAKYYIVISGSVAGMEVLNFTKDNATGNLTLGQAQTN